MNALCFFVSVIRYSGSLRKAIDENDWANVVLLTTRSARGVQGLFVVYNVYASWLSYSSVHTPVDLVLLDLCRPVQIASHFLFVSLNQDLRCPTSRSCSVSSPTNQCSRKTTAPPTPIVRMCLALSMKCSNHFLQPLDFTSQDGLRCASPLMIQTLRFVPYPFSLKYCNLILHADLCHSLANELSFAVDDINAAALKQVAGIWCPCRLNHLQDGALCDSLDTLIPYSWLSTSNDYVTLLFYFTSMYCVLPGQSQHFKRLVDWPRIHRLVPQLHQCKLSTCFAFSHYQLTSPP